MADSKPPLQRQLSRLHSGSDASELSSFVPSSRPSVSNMDLDDVPRYTTPASNIFIQALTIPIPNDENLELESREPLYRSLTAPDNYMESPSDEHLPRYFTKQYGSDTGTMGFPDIYGVMYAQGWTNPVLRHACLAVASFWAGRKMGQTFVHRAEAHINFLLPELQRAIRTKTFDDGHICAVYLLMSFALDTNRFRIMQRHGEGLVLMLRHLGYLLSSSNGRHSISEKTSPLVVHVWRLALRDDNMCGFGGPKYYKMCLPLMEMTDIPYERCMDSFLDHKRTHLKLIKRELLLKDLLTHRILHFQNQVSTLRTSSTYKSRSQVYETHILAQAHVVIKDIHYQRSKISEQYLVTYSHRHVQRFLQYPPFYTSSWDSYCLFIYNSQTYINATLIADPKLGRSETFPERTTAAIDLCRAAAGREKHLVPQAASLCFAGLAFIGDFPRG
jgi:hypothetical protein